MTDPIEPEDTEHGVKPDEEPAAAESEPDDLPGDEAPVTDRPTIEIGPLEAPLHDRARAEVAPVEDEPERGPRFAATETDADAAESNADAAGSDADAAESSADAAESSESGFPPDPEATVNPTGDFDTTVNLAGSASLFPARDDAAIANEVTRGHLKGLLEALIFASDKPIKAGELAKTATAPAKQAKESLEELKGEYATRGMQLDEVAGGWIFRTNAAYAPFVRDLTKQKPVKLTRAQIETLAIHAYRQPITRPEIDEIRGDDSGPVLKILLERDLVRILGKKDEPGRPWLYGTTWQFLEFFGPGAAARSPHAPGVHRPERGVTPHRRAGARRDARIRGRGRGRAELARA